MTWKQSIFILSCLFVAFIKFCPHSSKQLAQGSNGRFYIDTHIEMSKKAKIKFSFLAFHSIKTKHSIPDNIFTGTFFMAGSHLAKVIFWKIHFLKKCFKLFLSSKSKQTQEQNNILLIKMKFVVKRNLVYFQCFNQSMSDLLFFYNFYP